MPTKVWALYVDSSKHDVHDITLHVTERAALLEVAAYLRTDDKKDKRLSERRLARMTDATLRQHLSDYVCDNATDDDWIVQQVDLPPLFGAAPIMALLLRSLVNPTSTSDVEQQARALLIHIAEYVPLDPAKRHEVAGLIEAGAQLGQLLELLQHYCIALNASDSDHADFLDSGADVVQLLWEKEGIARALLAQLNRGSITGKSHHAAETGIATWFAELAPNQQSRIIADLDEQVHEAKAAEAARINNDGIESQAAYLAMPLEALVALAATHE